MGPPRRVLPLTRFLRRTSSHFAGKRSGCLKGIGGAGVSCGTLLASVLAVKRFACEESWPPSVGLLSVKCRLVAPRFGRYFLRKRRGGCEPARAGIGEGERP